MTAAMAAVLAAGGDLPQALRTGAAAGALNVTRRGLGSGDADAIANLARLIRLNRSPSHEEDVVSERHMTVGELAEGAQP